MAKLCGDCVTDRFLRAWVEEQGAEGTCTYCEQDGVCVELRSMAEEIDRAIRNYYNLASEEPHMSPHHDNVEYYAEGETAEEIMNDIISPAEAVADIVSVLSAREERDVRDGADALYDDSPLEHIGTAADGYLETWEAFEQRLKHEVRFFDAEGRRMLDELFGDLPRLGDGRAIATLTPDDAELKIYRARIINDESHREDFIRDPARHIGPPPPVSAKSGRMNPAGIPAFYGAFSSEVALAEIRPPVGSLVAVGEFSLLRPIRLLDMSFLPFAYHNESIFSPSYDQARSKVRFLEVFHRRISRPVLPSDEALAYIPTQAVAAYVTNVLGLDGIIYSSTQVGAEGESTGDQLPRALCNVVLFGGAAIVERTPAPPRPPDPVFDDGPLPEVSFAFPGFMGPAAAAPATPIPINIGAEASQAAAEPIVSAVSPGTSLIPVPDGLGEDGSPATLRIKRDPSLGRIRAVKVETSSMFAHLYDDGRVLFDDFEDDEN